MLFGNLISVFMPFVQSLGRQFDHIAEIIKNDGTRNGVKGDVSCIKLLFILWNLHSDLSGGIG